MDDMFMITAVQAQAYRVTQDMKYITRAAREMVVYLDSLQLDNGLFYHAPSAPYCWGRANGWMAVGMAELLRILPETNPDYAEIMAAYLKMMKTLKETQNEKGMWRQLVDDPELWEETSGSAMFTYAIKTKHYVNSILFVLNTLAIIVCNEECAVGCWTHVELSHAARLHCRQCRHLNRSAFQEHLTTILSTFNKLTCECERIVELKIALLQAFHLLKTYIVEEVCLQSVEFSSGSFNVFY
jgi:hypothetical protein